MYIYGIRVESVTFKYLVFHNIILILLYLLKYGINIFLYIAN